jgi:DNA polymerase-3 subunit epsilon
MEKRTLEAAYRFYCNAELTDAHSADFDTKATYEVLKAQLDRYPELQNDVEFLSKFTKYNRNVDYAGRIVFNENGVEVFNFGKHKGKPVEQVLREEPAYYSWMMNGDFPLYTKKVLTSIRLRMRG